MLAMQSTGVRRLICISASGLDPGPGLLRGLVKQVLWLMFKEAYTDIARMEAAVKASDLDWTIIRPPRLTNGPRTEQYHLAVNQHLARGWSISRADLADYIVTHLEDLIAAVKGTAEDKTHVDPAVAGKLFAQISQSSVSPNTSIAAELSEREREVLRLLTRGLTNTDIAQQLHLSEGTVRNYVSAVFAKLGVSDRAQAAVIALRHGLAD